MYQSNTTNLYHVYYCIRATCFDSYRITSDPSKKIDPYWPEDDSIRIETCCSSTIINIIILLCLTDTSLYVYIRVKHFGMANI